MRVLVTGVPGWLGTRFLEVLRDDLDGISPPKDWEIRALAMPGTDLSRLDGAQAAEKCPCIEADLRDPSALEKARDRYDVVFHIAGVVHPRRVGDFYSINTRGTENLLRACMEWGAKRFVLISSNAPAGMNRRRDHLLQETDAPRPYLHYGLSKWRAEERVKQAYASGAMETVILRPCWFYGPYQPERQTVFFKMIRAGRPLLFGDGQNLRSMSYTDNVCQAMILAAEQPQAAGQTYWIADRRPYPVLEIYQTIAELLQVKNFRPIRAPRWVSTSCAWADRCLQGAGLYVREIHVAGEMSADIACSIEKARRELGYEPVVELREGMRRSIEWCRSRRLL